MLQGNNGHGKLTELVTDQIRKNAVEEDETVKKMAGFATKFQRLKYMFMALGGLWLARFVWDIWKATS